MLIYAEAPKGTDVRIDKEKREQITVYFDE
jgi:hypothetical protein